MSKRARERKQRLLVEKQMIHSELKARELARTAPMRSMVRRILYTVVGTGVVVAMAWGGVAGGKYLMSGNWHKVVGPFGAIEVTELEANKNLIMHTSQGDIAITLDTQNTPKTAANFVLLAKQGFYDGTKFHRVMKDFMVQGGDPNSKDDDKSDDGMGGPGYHFPDEPIVGEYKRGVFAMANSGPDTNGSQFFIMQADSEIAKNYVIFGSVTEGMDVVDKMVNMEVVANDSGEVSQPVEDIILESIEFSA